MLDSDVSAHNSEVPLYLVGTPQPMYLEGGPVRADGFHCLLVELHLVCVVLDHLLSLRGVRLLLLDPPSELADLRLYALSCTSRLNTLTHLYIHTYTPAGVGSTTSRCLQQYRQSTGHSW